MFSNAAILGGWKGKERSFVIIQETLTPIHESALILLPAEKQSLLKIIEYLPSPHAQGFILYGGKDEGVPSSIIEQINTFQKPVLIIKENNLQTIKKKIADMIELKSLGHFHYVWEGMTDYWLEQINKRTLPQLVSRLRLFIDDNLMLLKSDFSSHFDDEEGLPQSELKEIRDLYFQQIKKKDSWLMVQNHHHYYLLFPLRVEEQVLGYIVFKEQPGTMLDTCIEIVTHAIPAILTALKREEAIITTHQMYQENFLYNLLYNNIESEDMLIRLGKQWQWDFTKSTQLMVLRLESREERSIPKNDINVLMGTIRSIIAARFLKVITHHLQGNVVIIIFDPFERSEKERKEFMLSLANSMIKAIEKVNSTVECQIGIGRQYRTSMKLYKSFYEGKIALELGKYEMHQQAVWHFEDIGIARLLANIQNDILHEYYEEVLGDLIHLEQNKDDFYIETLQEFFRNNGDINATATQLFVHPNTLRKRIKKIELTLSCDLGQMEDQLKLMVALKIMKMLT
jgi:sugar diacid utilization regulator